MTPRMEARRQANEETETDAAIQRATRRAQALAGLVPNPHGHTPNNRTGVHVSPEERRRAATERQRIRRARGAT